MKGVGVITYVALLRGINVSGQKSIRMADLVKLFESLKFRKVRTYVQSGNVVFESGSADASAIAGKIEKKIRQKYGFDVSVIIRTPEELETIISRNPFAREHQKETERLYVTFLAKIPDDRLASDLDMKKDAKEKFTIKGKEIYLYCPNGYGRTKLNNTTFERKLKLIATTRNWKTTTTLLEMAKSRKA